MTLRPCITCGEPSEHARCDEHALTPPKSPRDFGYDAAWDKLSVRARRMQPFCSRCGTPEDLTCDHTEEAWRRKARGQVIRLADVDVLCRSCNGSKGSARPRGEDLDGPEGGTAGEAIFASHTPGGYESDAIDAASLVHALGFGILDGKPARGGELDPLPLAVMNREHAAVEGVSAPLAGVREHFAVGERHHEVSHAPSLP